MKFSENWLRSLVNPSCSSDELAHALTMAGIEVENIQSVAAVFDQVVVAEVISVNKHPAADRLSVCVVSAGKTEEDHLQIVCGAPNVRAGIKVPCALVGANLPGFTIKKAKLRGVESSGMLCSAKELGISEAAEGLLILPDDAEIGMDFRQFYELDDRIFTLSLTPNRADCLGVYGIAREVAAITATSISPFEYKAVTAEIADSVDVHILDSQACPLYCGRVIRDIRSDAVTPSWMIKRLERSGLRPINPVVDITNYVLLETGQPMHAFDLSRISGSIQVRYAKYEEHIQLLNGNKVELEPDMLLIADEQKPLALAGIMGGMDSSVTAATTSLFLECAFFKPGIISGKSFRLGFNSDSAYRFERGVDFAATNNVLHYATDLIQKICGGKAGPAVEVKHTLPPRSAVVVRADRVRRVLGIDMDQQQIGAYFKRLGFQYTNHSDTFTVTPPSYRFDLSIEEDFIEELARIHGYDHIHRLAPRAPITMLPAPEAKRLPIELKQLLVSRDYQEVVNYAFVDTVWEHDLAGNGSPIALQNPIASHMGVMRSTLIGGLIANLQFNLNRKQSRIRLFEMGCCFIRNETTDCQQTEKLAGLCYGDAVSEQWGIAARTIDYFDVKADIETLFGTRDIHFEKFVHPALHPGKSAQIRMNNQIMGWLGELHPRWQKKYELQKNTVLFEIDLQALINKSMPIVKEIAKFPPVRRDMAIIIDNDVSVHSLLSGMLAEKPAIVTDISLFDIYRGKGMENNKKSLAFRVLLQDTEKTLTDEEADGAMAILIQILEKRFGAALRK